MVATNFIGGGVNTADGLKVMREQCFNGDRAQTRNVGILITGNIYSLLMLFMVPLEESIETGDVLNWTKFKSNFSKIAKLEMIPKLSSLNSILCKDLQTLHRIVDIIKGACQRKLIILCLTTITKSPHLLVDERPTINQGQVQSEARQAKTDYTYLVAVGITNSIDEGTIRGISSTPQLRDTTYFMIPSYDDLDSVSYI